jgi:glutamate N-acetyltransferase/amino-acid N-acetyltransferase
MSWISPFAPTEFPDLPEIGGVRLATAEAGIKYRNRKDLLLVCFDRRASVGGVLTRSKCASAPVEWCRDHLPGGRARALVVNSGNANAFTGVRGRDSTQATADAAADAVGCAPEEVFLASTGVIGEPLDPAPFARHLGDLADRAAAGNYLDAARAIMTTDSYPKVSGRRADLAGASVGVTGIAKGSGMIAPDMATMLAFVFTDAALAPAVVQAAVERAVAGSFNCVTVDSDTSTSDTLLLFATGTAQGAAQIDDPDDPVLDGFYQAVDEVCRDLAVQVAKDGEGLSKFIEVRVRGAVSDQSARKIALSVANSPLVKTAFAGEDANWGRVVMAVGKAGEPADRDRLSIYFGEHRVASDGERDLDYSEEIVSNYMKNSALTLTVELGLGEGQAHVWTCDLTHDYISINADYRS